MKQQIRFCTTSDGVRIAYATLGKGPPLVRALGWFSHLDFDFKFPGWERSLWGLLSRNHLFARYDGRGFGLSDRNVKGFSLDAKVQDLEAVVDALNLPRVSLLGTSEGGPTAIAYTVKHPERVSRLILYGSFAGFPPPATQEEQQLMVARLMTIIPGWGQDTPEFRQLWTARFLPDGDLEHIRWFNEMQRVAAAPETVAAFMGGLGLIDVRHLLADVRVPTLVVHRRGDLMCPFEGGRELASLIPEARFVPLEGSNHIPMPDEPETEQFAQLVEEFLAENAEQEEPGAAAAAPSGVVTILFTDMEGSTTLTQRLGDARAQEVLHTHNAIVRDSLKAHDGTEIKHTGDGIMASFGSARRALESAITIQRAFASHNADNPNAQVRVRVGLNAGEPVAEDDDLFGTAVQLAARACAHAEPGQIVIPDGLRHLVAGKDFLFADLGDSTLKGFEDPVRLYELRWREAG